MDSVCGRRRKGGCQLECPEGCWVGAVVMSWLAGLDIIVVVEEVLKYPSFERGFVMEGGKVETEEWSPGNLESQEETFFRPAGKQRE